MRPIKITFLVASLLLNNNSIAQDTLDFHLNVHNNIVLKAILNESDSIDLMFHTAVGDISVIAASESKTTSLNWNIADSVESWGGSSEARISDSNDLQMGAFSWKDLTIWECQRSGPDTDGKVGLNAFDGKHVEINYNDSCLILHDVLPAKYEQFTKCPIKTIDGSLFLTLNFQAADQEFTHDFLLHSGYGGTLLLDDAFANEHQLAQNLTIIDQKILKDSYGNSIVVNKAELPEVSWDKFVLLDVPVGFFEGTIGRQQMSVLGADFLRRFQLILNADRTHVYVLPSGYFDAEYSKI